jgi:hypothetical protein
MAGTLLGAGLGTWITSADTSDNPATEHGMSVPYVGVLGFSETTLGQREPVFGAKLDGIW